MPDTYDAAVIGTSGLKAYWPCDDVVGGTLNAGNHFIAESSGAWPSDTNLWWPYDATKGVTGAASIMPGTASTCLHVLGAGSFAVLWTALSAGQKLAVQPTGSFTICGWVNFDSIVGTSNFLIGQWNGTNIWHDYENLNGVNAVTAPPLLYPYNTYFVAQTYDGASSKLWINGNVVSTKAVTGSFPTGSVFSFEFGGMLGGSVRSQYMQKWAIFNAALSQAQLQNFYLLGASTFTEDATTFNVCPFDRPLLAADPTRIFLGLVNPSDTAMYVTLSSGASAAHTGILLRPNGGSYTTTDPVFATAAVGASHSGPGGTKRIQIQVA